MTEIVCLSSHNRYQYGLMAFYGFWWFYRGFIIERGCLRVVNAVVFKGSDITNYVVKGRLQ